MADHAQNTTSEIKRYLTKSRFKVACDCPVRLYYNDRPQYGNKNKDNEFLQALAQGGFQVGALAKLMYPSGIDLESLSTQDAIAKTDALLLETNVTIFEAAIRFEDCLVRVDILEKRGNSISLIEVKAKSRDFEDSENEKSRIFKIKQELGLMSGWRPYIVDIAFQTWVANQAHPNWNITPYLMLADTSKVASIDGLHQCFKLKETEHHRTKVVIKAGTADHMGTPLLNKCDVSDAVAHIFEKERFEDLSFVDYVNLLRFHLAAGTQPPVYVGKKCKSCEFRIPVKTIAEKNQLSGFEECWQKITSLTTEDLRKPMIFDLWRLHHTKISTFIQEGKYFQNELVEDDLLPKTKPKKDSEAKNILTIPERQWLQIQGESYFDIDAFRKISLIFPLHFIDFETTMVAIPFYKGQRPYEQVAFQFSHHVMTADGKITHKDEFLSDKVGEFPNFEFLRALKNALSTDRGTIFRYANHENTVLRQIRKQILQTQPPDADDLISFIDSITQPTEDEIASGVADAPGSRNMIDLLEMVKNFYYHPQMGGSNSIKKVCPAILSESSYLQNIYNRPVYMGTNFKNWTWIEKDPKSGLIIDPYKRLPKLLDDVMDDVDDAEGMERLFPGDKLNDGGAAMMAYARMQFTEMSDAERKELRAALLKYCELDTLSMVWIIEDWLHRLQPN